MSQESYLYLSARFWRKILALVLIAIFIIAFWQEVTLIWQLIVTYIWSFSGKSVRLPLSLETFRAAFVLVLNISIIVVGYFLLILWISQFVLPVYIVAERRRVFEHLSRYTLPFHSRGPGVYVRNGKPLAIESEFDRAQAGVAFVDVRSAIVLEQQYGQLNEAIPEVYFADGSESTSRSVILRQNRWQGVLNFFGLIKKMKPFTIVRAVGPGLVFTEKGEAIIGWADLRKQSRTRVEVYGCTRDGIEVKTHISTTFTLGQPAEILPVTKVKGDWLVIHIKDVSTSFQTETSAQSLSGKAIREFSDELENEDKLEIDSLLKAGNLTWSINRSFATGKQSNNGLPYFFNGERVFQAVYSRARDVKVGKLGEWTDLPVDVAAEIFRNMLANETYDYLYRPEYPYRPDDPKSYPLEEFEKRFKTKLRNKGVLGYQIVRRKDGKPLEEEQMWIEAGFLFSSPQEFKRSDVLRDRGIKIINASFSELIPTSEIIRQQFLDNWRAHWQQETEMTLAGDELEVMRILNRERAKAQQDMVYSLSQIFQTEQYTNEALAMRLYQALEAAATRPATQRLLPEDTIQMLTNLRQWLLPDGQERGNTNDANSEESPSEDHS